MGLVKTYVNLALHDSLLQWLRLHLIERYSYPQLVGVRIALGVAEAGLFPGVAY